MNPVNHWRTKDKAEVDFIVHQEGEIIPIEVKFSNLKKNNISRSFRSFINRYNPSKALVVNLELDDKYILDETSIEFIPYWKLM